MSIIKKAITVLKKGGLVVYPTETCYGIGADATNPKAVSKLLQYKGARKEKPISVAVADVKMAKKYIVSNPTADNIFKNLLPGPITVVCQGKHKVDPRLESQEGTLGIRIPDLPLALKIIKAFGKPITATSANISSGNPPYRISDLKKRRELIDFIIDVGQLPHRPPSVVIDTTKDKPEILRQGEIDFHQLSAKTVISHSEKETRKIAAKLLQMHKQRPLVFALQGDLGTGKTQFCKGLAKALGIKEIIKSPTFNLVNEYPLGKNFFYHLDAWRLQSPQELESLNLKEMIRGKNIIAIEWIQKGKDVLKKAIRGKKAKIIWIKLEHVSKTERRITLVV